VLVMFVTGFNVGEYRRNMTGSETVTADFFHPTNDEARRIRELVDFVDSFIAVNNTLLYVFSSIFT